MQFLARSCCQARKCDERGCCEAAGLFAVDSTGSGSQHAAHTPLAFTRSPHDTGGSRSPCLNKTHAKMMGALPAAAIGVLSLLSTTSAEGYAPGVGYWSTEASMP